MLRRVKAQVSDEEFRELGIAKDSIRIPHLTKPPLSDIPEIQRIMDETGHLSGSPRALFDVTKANSDAGLKGG